ncbi:MAG: alcohol dehydrogenase catalytic domain-containing protein [Acidimicrobiales bacterium]
MDVGDGVDGIAVGDRVAVDPNLHCGECAACGKGLHNLCERLEAYGVTTNGGFAEYSIVADHAVTPIGDLSASRAALAEPLGCVLNGLSTINFAGKVRAAVVGAGPIGMLMALAIEARGLDDVTMIDIDPDKLRFAEGFGLNPIEPGSDEYRGSVRSFDLVVDATGSTKVAGEVVGLTANGGSALLFGVCPPGEKIEIEPNELFRRQISVGGSHSLNHNIAESLGVIEQIGDRLDRLVSHQLPLDEVARSLTADKPTSTMKVQYVPA